MPAPEDSATASPAASEQIDTSKLEQQAAAIETAEQAGESIKAASDEAAARSEAPVTEERGAPFDESLPPTEPATTSSGGQSEVTLHEQPRDELGRFTEELTPGEAAAIDQMTGEFLRWPLPSSVAVDLIALEKGPGRVGTNLLSAVEAKAMLVDVVLPHLRQRGEPIPSALAGNVAIKVLEPALGLLVLELVNQVARLRADAVDFWGNGNHAGHTLATEKAELLNGIIEKLLAL